MENIAYSRSDTPAEAYAKGLVVGGWDALRRPAPSSYASRQREAWRFGVAEARLGAGRKPGEAAPRAL
jgi:hypothetical protein